MSSSDGWQIFRLKTKTDFSVFEICHEKIMDTTHFYASCGSDVNVPNY